MLQSRSVIFIIHQLQQDSPGSSEFFFSDSRVRTLSLVGGSIPRRLPQPRAAKD